VISRSKRIVDAIEKRCINGCWFLVCQFLAAWHGSMSKLAWPAAFSCPAALGDRPRFWQPGEPRRSIIKDGGTSNSDRQAFDTIGSSQKLATDCKFKFQRRATRDWKQVAGAGHHHVVAVVETGC
jgi:hypothetical protein